MTFQTAQITLDSPEKTAHLATDLGRQLRAGDVILLGGGIGAGKTHFARSLIQSLMKVPEDVPSPTFTLVQVYDTDRGEVWHSDLYRLGGADDCVELGLVDAFETAICLIEWPDRLEDLTPETALHLEFSDTGEEDRRNLSARWSTERWSGILPGILSGHTS